MKSKHEPWCCCLERNPERGTELQAQLCCGTGMCTGAAGPWDTIQSSSSPCRAQGPGACMAKAGPARPVMPARCHGCLLPMVSPCWGGSGAVLGSQSSLMDSAPVARSPGARGPRVPSHLGAQPPLCSLSGDSSAAPSRSGASSPSTPRLSPRCGIWGAQPGSSAGAAAGAGGQMVGALMNMEQ